MHFHAMKNITEGIFSIHYIYTKSPLIMRGIHKVLIFSVYGGCLRKQLLSIDTESHRYLPCKKIIYYSLQFGRL